MHDVETQHLPWQRVIHDARNNLLPIRCDLAIINLSVVAICDPDDNSRARRCGDSCLEIFLVDSVPDRGIVIQPIRLPGFGDFDSPLGPIWSAYRTADLEVGVIGVGCIPAGDSGGLENAANSQSYFEDSASFSADREGLLMAAIVEASVRLWRVLCGALVVQEELMEASDRLHGFVWQQLRRRRETALCGTDLSATATKSRQAKKNQRFLQELSRRAKPETTEDLRRQYRHVASAFPELQPRRSTSTRPEEECSVHSREL